MNSLVTFWSKFDFQRKPYIHPDDKEMFGDDPVFTDRGELNHRSFVQSDRFGSVGDKAFHLSLLPVPYIGDLRCAEIFVLLLNPGLGLSDYQADEDAVHTRMLRRTLEQDLSGVEFPFMSLNPDFAWSGGFQWWEKKLRGLIQRIAEIKQWSYLESMRFVSTKLAAIEMVPYHSRNYHAGHMDKELPSAIAARKFVREEIARRNVRIIVTRAVQRWGLPKKAIVAYSNAQARGASLSLSSPGGKAILAQLGIPGTKQ